MKKIFIGIAMLASFSAYAGPISQKVINKFNEVFPGAQSVKWYDGDSYYGVSFKEGGMLHRVYYDRQGNVFRTIRYYDGAKLCPFIIMKLKEEYGNKTIKGVTEVQENSGLTYQVVLEDQKHMLVVNCNEEGDMSLQKKYKKV